jgi:hypothetical protein
MFALWLTGICLKGTDFGGELSGGKSGQGFENKVTFVADLSLDDDDLTRWN